MTKRFFGYGSLVNTATHLYGEVEPATVQGWRRQWVQSNARPVSYLSVTPDPLSRISGVIANVGDAGWEALDIREAAYDRLTLPDPHAGVAIYKASPQHVGDASLGQPILLSYIDVVVQGFFRMYGEDGVRDFFRSTTGWDTPVLNDRAAPVYPRAQVLTDEETAFADGFLEDAAATILEPT